jgi:hypothetical protein
MIESFPFRFVLVVLAGSVNCHQLDVIEYLREENRVLREHIGKRRLRLTDAQRRRVTARGCQLGRQGYNGWRRSSRLTPFGRGTGD